MSQRSSRLRGSSPVVGSSRNSTCGHGHEAGGEVEAAAHAAGERLHQLVGGVGEVEALEQLVGPARRRRRLEQVVEPPDHHEVLPRAEQPVDGGLLRGDADARGAPAAGSADDVEAGDRAPMPVGGRRQRGEDADGGGLAGAVVAEQAEHGARGDVEIEVAQRPEVAEALAEAAGPDAAPSAARPGGARGPFALFVWRTVVRT